MIVRSNMESKVPLTLVIIVFLVTYFINDDFQISYAFNYAVIVGFIALSLFLDGKISLGNTTYAYLLLVSAVVVFSFLPNSVRDGQSNNHAISIVVFFLCYALSVPSATELKKAEKVLLFFAFLFSLYVITVKVVPNIYWDHVYPHLSSYSKLQAENLMINYDYGVPIGGSSVYADYMTTLGLVVCFGKLFTGHMERKKELQYIILSTIFFVAMVIQNRRGELISALFSVLLMYLMSENLRFIQSKKFRRAIGVIAIIIIGILFLRSQGLLDRYINMFAGLSAGSSNEIERVGNGRVALWNSALKKFYSSPLMGIGWNQFRATGAVAQMEGFDVHNDYLQVLCETGVIGFALIYIPMIYLWLKAFSRCRLLFKRKTVHNDEVKNCVLMSFGIQTFFMILHFLDPCLYKLIFWPMFSFSITLYNRSIYAEEQNDSAYPVDDSNMAKVRR